MNTSPTNPDGIAGKEKILKFEIGKNMRVFQGRITRTMRRDVTSVKMKQSSVTGVFEESIDSGCTLTAGIQVFRRAYFGIVMYQDD